MPTEATAQDIAAYLADEDVHSVGMIHTCIEIIGKYDPSDANYNGELVIDAVESLVQWMYDYGVRIDADSIFVDERPVTPTPPPVLAAPVTTPAPTVTTLAS